MGINALVAAAAEGGQSILIPAAADLIWGSVSFVILLVMFSKYVLPRFNRVLEERAEKIEGGIARAEKAQADADAALKSYTAQLAEARSEASNIRAAAEEAKKTVLAEASARAEADRAATAKRAQEQIIAERSQAASTLQREVGALALDLASKVVGDSLHDDARARAVVDAFIADLERQASEAGR